MRERARFALGFVLLLGFVLALARDSRAPEGSPPHSEGLCAIGTFRPVGVSSRTLGGLLGLDGGKCPTCLGCGFLHDGHGLGQIAERFWNVLR
jgi:hypothetical protein